MRANTGPRVAIAGNQQWVYARGLDHEIHSNYFNGTTWSGFARLAPGSIFEGDPRGS
jgi:hypothetical protein